MTDETHLARLEYLRGEIRAERISYGELAELADLAEHIDPSDVELRQWAGLPEHEDTSTSERIDTASHRRAVLDAPDSQIEDVVRIVRAALEGDSNADHDALVMAAELLGIEWEEQ